MRTRMLGWLCELLVALIGRAARDARDLPAPSAWTQKDWSAHEHDFFHGGTRIRYCDYGAGPVLVLLHGMACCWQWWLECLPELGWHYRVIAVDLPGFGSSDSLAAPAEMTEYAEVVAGLLDDLGVRQAAVAGHSMGGLVAIALATAQPQLVTRLVLVDSGGVPMNERRLESVLQVLRIAHASFSRPMVLRLLARNRTMRRLLLRGAMRNPDAMSDVLAAVVVPKLDAAGFVDSIRASANAVRTTAPESIRTPTTLIWGERDPFAPLSTAHEMLRRLPAGRLEVMAGVGHTPMVEAPEEFTELLIRAADSSPDLSSRRVV